MPSCMDNYFALKEFLGVECFEEIENKVGPVTIWGTKNLTENSVTLVRI